MQYFGGKAKIAKHLALFLNSQLKEGQPFVDLFCGSCNVVSKINHDRLRMANDLHPELIAMWQALQTGIVLPDEISEEEYKLISKDKKAYPAWLVGFAGFGSSFAGKYFGGFARCAEGKNYGAIAKRSTMAKAINLTDVKFSNGSYAEVKLPQQSSLIYCDIPYKDTTGYSTGKFNHKEFYEWAEDKTRQGHSIVVSEYSHNVPKGWEVMWTHDSRKSIRDKNDEHVATVEILMRPTYGS